MRKITIFSILIALIVAMSVIPTGFADDANSVVITYGETAYMNQNYKSMVDQYFENNAAVDLNNVETKVITASDVNAISSGISHKTYNSNQIFSSALVDLNQNGNIEVFVDNTITTITPKMYASALESAGIESGRVYVTSPVTATGESALAGIMNSYEEATDVEIPDNVKEAANNEIQTQAAIVENSNVSADDLSKLVDEVKDTVEEENITDHAEIVNIINDYSTTYNINISDSDIDNLASTIEQIQSVQADADSYKEQLNDVIDNASSDGFSLDSIFNSILSAFGFR
ncbi:DUF1002 domain-containing protein [uncultured Methanobrevibacter sp.]|uniref:DUF1002 domain-containing protein n=1 Tax=uncultured Methanobrevibacter sp. TaxID=253161 RepID=UPI002611F636